MSGVVYSLQLSWSRSVEQAGSDALEQSWWFSWKSRCSALSCDSRSASSSAGILSASWSPSSAAMSELSSPAYLILDVRQSWSNGLRAEPYEPLNLPL